MPFFFASAFLESESPTSELGGSEFFANIRAKDTKDAVSFLSQLCGSDLPATSAWIEVVITPAIPSLLLMGIPGSCSSLHGVVLACAEHTHEHASVRVVCASHDGILRVAGGATQPTQTPRGPFFRDYGQNYF